ncbi:MAG: potassium uptake system protein [Deltaproteobacteria bacterium CG1_02_45_11]|nr:MAG: potassium uptake system protein [Deltaproteobacteria bacterium CG1_02_45_11]
MRQFAVIGLGRFGSSVATTLGEKGAQVLAIDKDSERVQDISSIATQAVCLDATDEKALKAVGIENVDVAVVSTGPGLEASILITLTLKEIGIPEIVAKALNDDHGKVLSKVGATKLVFPERDMGVRLANNLFSPKVIEQINISGNSSIVEIMPSKEFIGKSLRQIDMRATYGLNVIAIKKRLEVITKFGERKLLEEKVDFSPHPDEVLKEDDILLVVGKNDNIEILKKA